MAQPLDLGPGPGVLGNDPASEIQRNAGFEVSDFHGAFTAGAIFQPTPHFKALGPIEVLWAGSIELGGALAVFDPLDAAAGETICTFQREVPAGRHDVFLSRAGSPVASLVRFRDVPVARWSPALFSRTRVCPRPPLLPMFPTRFAVSYVDPDVAEEGELAPGAEVVLEALRRGAPPEPCEGFVAFDVGGAGRYASWFGEDASGAVVALATEYGRLRHPTVDSVRIPVRDASAGFVPLEDRGLALRATPGPDGLELWLRPRAPETLEQIRIVSQGGDPLEPSSIAHEGRTTIFRFPEPPTAAAVIRLDFVGVSRPLLHLEPGSVARKLEGWRLQGLLEVDPASIPALAQRLCEREPAEVLDWLADQDEVEDVFF